MSIETVRCENCKETMTVRTADIKRGWGRFCSKSCKAKKQTRSRRRGYYPEFAPSDFEAMS